MKALVTGATRGPGRAMATALARAGWEVHALGRDRVVLEEMRCEQGIIPMAVDLTDRDFVRNVVDGMNLDLLIHAAQRWPAQARFLEIAEADIDMALEVNLSAMLHLSRTVMLSMIGRGRGMVLVAAPRYEEAGSVIERSVAAAARDFALSVSTELAGTGVSVEHLPLGSAPFDGLAERLLELVAGAVSPGQATADRAFHEC